MECGETCISGRMATVKSLQLSMWSSFKVSCLGYPNRFIHSFKECKKEIQFRKLDPMIRRFCLPTTLKPILGDRGYFYMKGTKKIYQKKIYIYLRISFEYLHTVTWFPRVPNINRTLSQSQYQRDLVTINYICPLQISNQINRACTDRQSSA